MTCRWLSCCRPLNLRSLVFYLDGRNTTRQGSITLMTNIKMVRAV